MVSGEEALAVCADKTIFTDLCMARCLAVPDPLDPEVFRFGAVVRVGRTLVSMALHRAGRGPAPVPYDGKSGERKLLAHLAGLGIEAGLLE